MYFPIHTALLMGAVYFHSGVLVKRFFRKEKYRTYAIYSILTLAVGLICVYLVLELLATSPPPKNIPLERIYVSSLARFTGEFLLILIIKIAKEWYVKYETVRKREFEYMKTELTLLRTQLDPHFMFNTLNNIYLLVLDKSPKASDSVLLLSELLNYVLYESYDTKVEIAKEIEFIESYISLQKLRLDPSQHVIMQKDGLLQGNIAPLIVFNFIENAFKHAQGMHSSSYGYCYIAISLKSLDGYLHLSVTNGRSQGKECQPQKKKGIGIENTRKRLSLIYDDRYLVDIQETASIYSVQLKVPIDEDKLPDSRR